ncbi:hypothetical protein [Bdellovibrio sp. HCB209]|uniref:hypothetical protein n=1 Tax=Bdellovibrio sp. HCB209 TaxID=3394354 RepID=UPI0039B48F9A
MKSLIILSVFFVLSAHAILPGQIGSANDYLSFTSDMLPKESPYINYGGLYRATLACDAYHYMKDARKQGEPISEYDLLVGENLYLAYLGLIYPEASRHLQSRILQNGERQRELLGY